MDGSAKDGSSKRKVCPSGFRDVFIEEGWRGVELEFGSRTACNKRWVAECGGDQLKRERLEFLKRRSAQRTAERLRMIEKHRAWRRSV